ncbi:hypothetical protein M406DRAFT_272504, partial [Cryphonectria parasitica EP155]
MPSSMSSPRPEAQIAQIGCQSCRDQHLKCDRVTPICGRCVANNKECIRGYKFRIKNGPFPKKQRWARVSRRLRFVDETRTASGDNEEHPAGTFQDDWPDSYSEGSDTLHTADTTTITTEAGPAALHVQPYPTPPELAAGGLRPHSPTDRFIPHDDHVISPARNLPPFRNLMVSDLAVPAVLPVVPPLEVETEDPAVQAMRSRIYRDQDAWPLESREEAMLFQHYIQKLSIW